MVYNTRVKIFSKRIDSSMERTVQRNKNTEKKIKRAIARYKRKLLKHVWLVRALLVAGIILGIYLFVIGIKLIISSFGVDYYINMFTDFVFTPDSKIEIMDGRTNLVILGKGGNVHEAPDLTDTIIFVSVSKDKSSVDMTSLPRDIWIPELRTKLNSAYYWGNQKEEGGGLVLAKSEVEKIVGQPVHYGLVIDFEGFVEAIDVLGGVEVDVQKAFTDEKYPIVGKEDDECDGDPEYLCRYETISFEAGRQVMDGETALKFARSRNAQGDNGTDLARAARQQKILNATKDAIMSKEVLLSPKKMLEIRSVLTDSVETDIDTSAATVLARYVFNARNNISSHVLSEDLLVNPPKSYLYDNLYVFVPKSEEGWSEIHEWVQNLLAQ